MLGYIPKDNRVYLGDKELGVVSYSLQLAVLEYQTAIMRKDFDTADKVCPVLSPHPSSTRVSVGVTDHSSRPAHQSGPFSGEAGFQAASSGSVH